MAKKINSVKAIITNHEWLTNWLSDASYGNYWASFGTHQDTDKELYETAKTMYDCREDIWAYILINGGYLLIEDREEEKEYKVSIKDIEKGFKKFMFHYPRQYANIMTEEGDMLDADCLLQTIVFGEEIYG